MAAWAEATVNCGTIRFNCYYKLSGSQSFHSVFQKRAILFQSLHGYLVPCPNTKLANSATVTDVNAVIMVSDESAGGPCVIMTVGTLHHGRVT